MKVYFAGKIPGYTMYRIDGREAFLKNGTSVARWADTGLWLSGDASEALAAHITLSAFQAAKRECEVPAERAAEEGAGR